MRWIVWGWPKEAIQDIAVWMEQEREREREEQRNQYNNNSGSDHVELLPTPTSSDHLPWSIFPLVCKNQRGDG
jgi:hypothetical protein